MKVLSVTCDGPKAHFAVLASLGAKITNVNEIVPWFPHSSNSSQKVHLLDMVHTIKLVRNSLHDLGVLLDQDGNQIERSYVEELEKLQSEEGLRAGNELKRAHIQSHALKMKVNLAVQLISASVATAIEFADQDLNLPQFKGSKVLDDDKVNPSLHGIYL